MFEFPLVAVLMVVAFMIISAKSIEDKKRSERNGKIEIKFTEINNGDEANTIKYTDLILEIRYRLVNGAKWNKEEVAILINDLIQTRFKHIFALRDDEGVIKEANNIMEQIRPLLLHKTDSELIDIKYLISKKIIPNWGNTLTLS